MTTQQHPAQFDWATELLDAEGHVTLSAKEAHEIGARLRSMGEKLKAYEDLDEAASDVQLLRIGYAAARLEIESLRARIKTMAEEHADELMVAHLDGRVRAAQVMPESIRSILVRCRNFIDTTKVPAYPAGADLADEIDNVLRAAQPAGVQQPGSAYADLMQEASDWICEHVQNETTGAMMWAIRLQSAAQKLRASHGQAPSVEREQERIAFKDAHRHLELYEVSDAWGRPMFKHSHVEASWLGWIARASHGQAPAQAIAEARIALSGIMTAQEPAVLASRAWPKVSGVSRDEGHSRALLVFFAAEPTDDEVRAVHDTLAAAPTTQPAPQQEPSYTSAQLAEMVLSDCGHSSNYTPLLNRVAARIDAHVERCLESKKTPQQEAQEPATGNTVPNKEKP